MVLSPRASSPKSCEGREIDAASGNWSHGKVGVNLIESLISDSQWRVARDRALCHNRTDLARLIDAAWTYRRAPGDPRKVWYPG